MVDEWPEKASWWLEETANDPIYQSDVIPLARELIGQDAGVILDMGCGEGQMMRALPHRVVGCDISPALLTIAARAGPVVRSRLPGLDWLRPESVDTAFAVLVIEHLADLKLFAESARIVKPGGSLVVVANHPAFTAASAGPIMDPDDGEFLWRWGKYFEEAAVTMPAGEGSLTFYHRPLEKLLNAAAAAGWMLERLIERGFSREAIASRPGYAGQQQMPRLLGARWVNTQGSGRFCR